MKAFNENENNSKKTLGIINELTSRKQNDSHIKEIKLSDPRDYRRRKTYFAGVGPNLIEKIPCDKNNCSYFEYLNCHNNSNGFELSRSRQLHQFFVHSWRNSAGKTKATRLDKIFARLLRYCPDLLLEPLP